MGCVPPTLPCLPPPMTLPTVSRCAKGGASRAGFNWTGNLGGSDPKTEFFRGLHFDKPDPLTYELLINGDSFSKRHAD